MTFLATDWPWMYPVAILLLVIVGALPVQPRDGSAPDWLVSPKRR